jgi:hypothetical protein
MQVTESNGTSKLGSRINTRVILHFGLTLRSGFSILQREVMSVPNGLVNHATLLLCLLNMLNSALFPSPLGSNLFVGGQPGQTKATDRRAQHVPAVLQIKDHILHGAPQGAAGESVRACHLGPICNSHYSPPPHLLLSSLHSRTHFVTVCCSSLAMLMLHR